MSLDIDFNSGGGVVLDRVIEAYGFKTKIALAEHIGIASSSLAMRYRRDFYPADIVVRCMAETGANLEWLSKGTGPKFGNEDLDIIRVQRKKIVDGQLYDFGVLSLDKAMFQPGKSISQKPLCIIDEQKSHIIEQGLTETYDGDWLVEIEGKISIRTLTHIPVKRVRVTGGSGAAFDCSIDDINVIGRVVLTIING